MNNNNDEATRIAEEAIIGSLFQHPAQLPRVRDDGLKPDDFKYHALGTVYRIMLDLLVNEMTIDSVTVGDEMERRGTLAEFGFAGKAGRAALVYMRSTEYTGARRDGAASYAVQVKDYAAKRRLLNEFNQGASWALNGRDAAAIQSDMLKRISAIETPSYQADRYTQTLAQAVSSAYDRVTAASRGEIKLINTGFMDLDKLLHGMEGGDFLILAGRPGSGKTALATNIAYNCALEGKCVALFTLEMQNMQIAMRLISMLSGVSYGNQKEGRLTEEEWPQFTYAVEKLDGLPIYLCDLPGIRLREIRQRLSKMPDIDLIVLDYLQLASPDDNDARNREQEVSKVARGLKMLAKAQDVPVLATAQLSRAADSRSDKRPMLSDLRESGELEQAADVVMFLYRPDQYEKDSAKQNIVEIVVAKQRNGAIGTIELIYRSQYTKFENAVTKYVNFRDRAGVAP
jgi:replicative DNA helicase